MKWYVAAGDEGERARAAAHRRGIVHHATAAHEGPARRLVLLPVGRAHLEAAVLQQVPVADAKVVEEGAAARPQPARPAATSMNAAPFTGPIVASWYV